MKICKLPGLAIFLLFFFLYYDCAGQALDSHRGSIYHHHMMTDTLYSSLQNINLLYLKKADLPGFRLEFAYPDSALSTCSQLASDHDALAAINGSFFDMDRGGSVSYFEKNDSVISSTRDAGKKWAVADSILNAAVLLHRDSGLLIEYAKPDKVYQKSHQEIFVMVSGPLLIRNAIPQKLPTMNFTLKRHPRTCIGITSESIIFITVDGRSDQAAGMTLPELQGFLLDLGCMNAINLDGGGSTSMWIKDQGIVNMPSDKTGERPVANALIIKKQ